MKVLIIKCHPNQLNSIKDNNLNWKYSPWKKQQDESIWVTVDNIDSLDEDDLCYHYGIDYDYVYGITPETIYS